MSLPAPFASKDSVTAARPSVFQWLDRFWNPVAILAWTVSLSAIIGRILASPDRVTNINRYLRAGRAWIEGSPLYIYTPNKGFVYGPFSAVCYAMASYLPDVWLRILWCLLSAALLLGGMWAMMTSAPFSQLPPRRLGLAFLLVLPLALGNFDSAQANAFLAGLIMIAFAAACSERWTIAAIALAVAIHWKVYPVVAGMLLVLLFPRRFSWRLGLAVVIAGLIPFLFQKASYVTEQYQLWYDTRTADNRLTYSLAIAPRDLWFVLVQAAGLPVSQAVYRAIQALSGLAIAVYCLWGKVKNLPSERLLAGAFSLVCAWMTLLGPASELYTYLLIAPAVAFEVVATFSKRSELVSRALVVAAFLFLLAAILGVAFFPQYENVYVLSLQPLGALLFLVYALRKYFGDVWSSPRDSEHSVLSRT
jgi:glycosyl transferase family 87